MNHQTDQSGLKSRFFNNFQLLPLNFNSRETIDCRTRLPTIIISNQSDRSFCTKNDHNFSCPNPIFLAAAPQIERSSSPDHSPFLISRSVVFLFAKLIRFRHFSPFSVTEFGYYIPKAFYKIDENGYKSPLTYIDNLPVRTHTLGDPQRTARGIPSISDRAEWTSAAALASLFGSLMEQIS